MMKRTLQALSGLATVVSVAGPVLLPLPALAQYYDPSSTMDSSTGAQVPAYGYGAPPAAPMGTFDWSGAYVGGVVGYGWGSSDVDYSLFSNTLKPQGAAGGIVGGINFTLTPMLVAGLEADATWNGLSDKKDLGVTEVTLRSDWQISARGRAGVAFDRFLVYGTAGLSFNGVEMSAANASNSQTLVGYAVGLGAEALVTQHFTTRAEFIYTGYADADFSVGPAAKASFDQGVLRAGVGYKF